MEPWHAGGGKPGLGEGASIGEKRAASCAAGRDGGARRLHGPRLGQGRGTQARQPVVLTLASFMRNGKCAHQRNRTLLSIVSKVVRNASLGEALLVRAQASSVLLPTGITAIRLMNSGWGP